MVRQAETNIERELAETHALRAWSLVHASFLLNRFHEHTALQATPYEIIMGRPYQGKILPFGEFVFGSRKPVKQKGTNLWIGGFWVGKNTSDMNLLLTENGQMVWVGRCAQPWRLEVILELTPTPKTQRFLEAPMPTILEKPCSDEAVSDAPSDSEGGSVPVPNQGLADGPQMDEPVRGRPRKPKWRS